MTLLPAYLFDNLDQSQNEKV